MDIIVEIIAHARSLQPTLFVATYILVAVAAYTLYVYAAYYCYFYYYNSSSENNPKTFFLIAVTVTLQIAADLRLHCGNKREKSIKQSVKKIVVGT